MSAKRHDNAGKLAGLAALLPDAKSVPQSAALHAVKEEAAPPAMPSPEPTPTEPTPDDTKPVSLTLRLHPDDWEAAHKLSQRMRREGDKTASVQSVMLRALDSYFRSNGLPGVVTQPKERGGDRTKAKA